MEMPTIEEMRKRPALWMRRKTTEDSIHEILISYPNGHVEIWGSMSEEWYDLYDVQGIRSMAWIKKYGHFDFISWIEDI